MEIINSVITLQPGMYILRHPKGGLAPLGIARAPNSGGGKLETLCTPGTDGAILRDGGDCIVVQVTLGPVELVINAFLAHKDDAVPALRLDRIGLDARGAVPAAAPAPATPATPKSGISVEPTGISLLGHVERSGDVVAAPGQCLGDPAAELRLEGFQLVWPDKPDGVDIAYGVVVEGAGALPIVKSGKFSGTRNSAKRITEITFALIGPRAAQYTLEGVAHFSGGFQQALQAAVPLSGPSGLEHLTALSLSAVPSAPAQQQSNPWQESARTKVFKAAAQ